ncbi:response regulator transcription factor [Sphingomonas glacialis]|uniref:DNA-binding response regulator n=1 Tax=Sphingomonas glacialis TaxID=658225 RepID=A0A502FB89_9SPHN|nr:response regulator [Sphingomonas glacialis]TPG46559.1 DNA-binding response regulator [Sphingomonas glacialis]
MSDFVYIVDDDPILRDILRSALLHHQNLHVQCFISGDAFLRDCEDRDPGVLLLDVQMPGSSGIDVLRHLSSEPKRFETIVLTATGNIAMAVEAMKYGARDFLEKPFEVDQLHRRIDQAFEALCTDRAANQSKRKAMALIASLSVREREVLSRIADGQANKVTAHELGVSIRTIETHRAAIMNKLAVTTISEAVLVAARAGMLRSSDVAETTDESVYRSGTNHG